MSVKAENPLLILCDTCLSAGRKLFKLNNMQHTFSALLHEKYEATCGRGGPGMQLCWECSAVMRRADELKRKAERAQQFLQWARGKIGCDTRDLKVTPEKSYSTLVISDIVTIDSTRISSNSGPLEYAVSYTPSEPAKLECEFEYADDAYEGELASVKVDGDEVEKAAPDVVDVKTEPGEIDASEEKLSKVKKKKKKVKKEEQDFDVLREIKQEISENIERKKRKYTTPFNHYTIRNITADEVYQQRSLDAVKPWYLKSPFKCVSCLYGFRSENQFSRHMRMMHSEQAGSFVCDFCQVRTKTKELLRKHIRTHLEQYECAVCKLTFGRIHIIRTHFATKHKTRKCKECPEEFYSVKELQEHRRSRHVHLQCDKCGKKCITRHALAKHLRKHEPYPCAECDKVFSSKKNLDQHRRYRHQFNSTTAYCVECDKQFKSRPSYLLHVNEKHSPRARHRCPVCEKPFNRKLYMTDHYKLVHLKKTDYYCAICDKYICRKDGLRKHMEYVHEGKKLPKNKMCDICGRGFSTNKVLIHHVRTHTGERPHQCEFCSAAFAQITALKTHVKHIHMQLKRSVQTA